MDLETLIAQWSGKAPPGFVRHAVLRHQPETCVQLRCNKPRALKANGEYAKSCSSCLAKRARSCKRRRAALTAEGSCGRCGYRKRLEKYVSYYTSPVPFVARLDACGSRLA